MSLAFFGLPAVAGITVMVAEGFLQTKTCFAPMVYGGVGTLEIFLSYFPPTGRRIEALFGRYHENQRKDFLRRHAIRPT